MNLLEHYIKEVISVEPYTAEWTKEFDAEFLKIKVVVECYGTIEERETVERKEEWEKIKKRGYFMW